MGNCGSGSNPVSASANGNGVDIRYANGSLETRNGGTRSWRNNNPGNLRSSQTQIGRAGGFAVFGSEAAGQSAKITLLTSQSYQNLTVGGAIARWAPPTENDTAAYQRYVQSQSGVSSDTPMNSLNQNQLVSISNAMRNYEGWKPGNVICRR